MAARLERLAADRRGGAVVEFAVLLPFLMTMILGTIDFGRMFYVRHGLEYATEEAARYYMLNPTTDATNVTTALRSKMPGGMGPNVNVSYADSGKLQRQQRRDLHDDHRHLRLHFRGGLSRDRCPDVAGDSTGRAILPANPPRFQRLVPNN